MKRLYIALIISSALVNQLSAQVADNNIDIGLGIGGSEGSLSTSYVHNWQLGKKKKWSLGMGGRLTNYLGKNQYYLTAPASITSGETGPQVFFIENIIENIDSVQFASAQVNSLNASFNVGYQVHPKVFVGFNIDLFGVSFGAKQDGRYFEGNSGNTTSGKPTSLNVLLISDNDIGSLNSELFARYSLNATWGIKAGFQFLFTEYSTDTEVQQSPEPNDRFRNKSAMFTAGITYFINKK
ncbi:MAG: hypothetical protein RIB71_12400 [Imperialibacter sp.]|uniref:hypothetical protein n=1 Tax=Imperialibacter sp. TaxID=2038411 RepID=UPI0032EE99C3